MTGNKAITKEVYQKTLSSILEIPGEYVKFLNTSANVYKYSFSERVLIHANKPKATAVADYLFWTKTAHRNIKSGAKGIPIFDDTIGNYRFVFDVSDTVGADIKLWRYNQKHNEQIVDTFFNALQMEDKSEDFTDNIQRIISVTAERNNLYEHISSYIPKEIYLSLVEKSVNYIVSKRLGINFTHQNFSELQYLQDNNRSAILVGRTISDLSENILSVVKSTVQKINVGGNEYEHNRLNEHRIQGDAKRNVITSDGGREHSAPRVRIQEVELFEGKSNSEIRTVEIQNGASDSLLRERETSSRDDGASTGTIQERESIGEYGRVLEDIQLQSEDIRPSQWRVKDRTYNRRNEKQLS